MLFLKRLESFPTRQEYAHSMDKFAGLDMQTSDALTSFDCAKSAVNVAFEDGCLKRSEGFGTVKWHDGTDEYQLSQLPESVTKLFEFQSTDNDSIGYKNFYYSDTEGNLYKFEKNQQQKRIAASLVIPDDIPMLKPYTYFTQFRIGATNRALLGGPECGPYVYTEDAGYSLIPSVNKPHMRHCVMHYGRMFGIGDPTYPQRVWFSKLNDPCDFTVSDDAGGYIDITDLIGSTVDVVSFFDTLYVFCRYGIVSLNSLTVQSDFSVENIYYADSEILPDSICVCGGGIMFATRHGVYFFNGSSVTETSRPICGFFDKIICREEASVYFKNRYFLSFHKTDGTCGLLIFNFSNGLWRIFSGADVRSMAVFRDKNEEKLLVAFDETTVISEWGAGDKVTTSGAISAIWRSPENDWGNPTALKTVREVHFSGTGNGTVTLTVTADGISESHNVTLNSTRKCCRLPFNITGCNISFQLSNCFGAMFNVTPLTFIYTAQRQMLS